MTELTFEAIRAMGFHCQLSRVRHNHIYLARLDTSEWRYVPADIDMLSLLMIARLMLEGETVNA